MTYLANQLEANPPPEWKRRPEVLLDEPLPVPMHDMAPRVALGREWWDAERAAAFAATDCHCIACGARAYSGHERYAIDWLLGRMVYLETVPLCRLCHSFCHMGYVRTQVESGAISSGEYRTIFNHGMRLTLGLGKKQEQGVTSIEWGEWRLVVNGQEFPPLYKDFAAYKEHFGVK